MITLIHGEDVGASRSFYLELLKKATNAQTLDAESLNLNALVQILEGGSLFETQINLFIENPSARFKTGSYDLKSFTSIVNRNSSKQSIVIYESKQLTSEYLKNFPGAEVKSFNFPKDLFAFLDALFI